MKLAVELGRLSDMQYHDILDREQASMLMATRSTLEK